MKRVRLLVLLGAIALALPFGLIQGVAGATGGGGTAVSIQQYADFNFAGTQLDVGLHVRCTGGLGLAEVTVKQDSPETGVPDTMGTGFNPDVVCDGEIHSVGVTVFGVVFDPGKAWAEADVTTPGGNAHAQRWITILVV
jgi:hypothetical protein